MTLDRRRGFQARHDELGILEDQTKCEPAFDGNFNDALRERLRRKREQCRVPIGQLCTILGVSPSTYRKWEAGKVTVCRFHNIQAVRMFLSGELDGQLHAHFLHGGTMQTHPGVSDFEMCMRTHFGNLMAMLAVLPRHGDLEKRISDNFIAYCNSCRLQVVEALMPRRPKG